MFFSTWRCPPIGKFSGPVVRPYGNNCRQNGLRFSILTQLYAVDLQDSPDNFSSDWRLVLPPATINSWPLTESTCMQKQAAKLDWITQCNINKVDLMKQGFPDHLINTDVISMWPVPETTSTILTFYHADRSFSISCQLYLQHFFWESCVFNVGVRTEMLTASCWCYIYAFLFFAGIFLPVSTQNTILHIS